MHPITDFASLLAAARAQPAPQRLLFAFCNRRLHDDHSAAEAARFAAGEGGILLPALCVDKSVLELDSFAALAQQADSMDDSWQVVFVAAIDDSGSADADAPLKRMVQTIQTGGDVGRYLAFNRHGELLQFL
ncbi:ribonucleotide reductase subunit alpha [Vogesella oryzae]|uniref:ribonucleotide reductase subunit alpha n=1 Tax=Vogesella oryzae TaxID=1735285 RepID=UPI00158157BF|nr:ribonucleotide reductase subunit alpha [Vogesella oryzae]